MTRQTITTTIMQWSQPMGCRSPQSLAHANTRAPKLLLSRTSGKSLPSLGTVLLPQWVVLGGWCCAGPPRTLSTLKKKNCVAQRRFPLVWIKILPTVQWSETQLMIGSIKCHRERTQSNANPTLVCLIKITHPQSKVVPFYFISKNLKNHLLELMKKIVWIFRIIV